jgi:hypothetical protein
MALTTMYLEVTDASDDKAIGNRWKDGTTTVILTPTTNFTGKWNTDRGSDIDSAGGTELATYDWRKREGFLLLELEKQNPNDQKDNGKKGLQNALLVLRGFKEYKHNSSGNGWFRFRSESLDVRWNAIFSAPEPSEKEDAANANLARSKINEAKSRGTRDLAELSLNEADSYARIIKNEEVRTTIEDEIKECRQELDKKIYKKKK